MMKKLVLTGFICMIIGTSAAVNHLTLAQTSERHVASNTIVNQPLEISTSDETVSLTENKLKELQIPEYNIPSSQYAAYKAANVPLSKRRVILTDKAGKGFQFSEGDIIRINAVNFTGANINGEYFNIGFINNGQYTNLTNGPVYQNIMLSAWDISENMSGEYKVYVELEEENFGAANCDFIITVEKKGVKY